MADGMTASEVFHSHSSLTYDDLIIMPGFIDFGVQDVKLHTQLTREIAIHRGWTKIIATLMPMRL